MNKFTGKNFIGNQRSAQGSLTFNAFNPQDGSKMEPTYTEATQDEINKAVLLAEKAFLEYRKKSGKEKAAFLNAIADEILALGDDLIKRCSAESGLPEGRITGERGRTMNQLKLFASLLEEGSWVDARIEAAIPDRQPLPKSDIRSMQIALGPVGVFGASNFPLAFSVAGGDTASALAAGCPVVVKGHPSHPGTCELISEAIINAVKKTNMPEGTFSLVQGGSVEVGMGLVKHPAIKAIGFTGSFKGGKAIFDAASQRSEPIPVYAEMGSTNPVFILPGALKERKESLAKGLAASVTLGVGQFCTNPGLVFTEHSSDSKDFRLTAINAFKEANAEPMLNAGIRLAYEGGVNKLSAEPGVEVLASGKENSEGYKGTAYLFESNVQKFIENNHLEEELFGPSTLMLSANNKNELLSAAKKLSGHLTATIHATEDDLKNYKELVEILELKVGRLIINGFPTGVEVCHSMVHGGPFPATTDSRSTSVGTMAITRFTRPVCYQDFPQFLLPDELKANNPLNIWRMVNGNREK